MTYRELLKLYQEGKLDKAQTDEVEHAIEKQEAISEYLYEKEEIPGLEVLQGQEKEEVFVQGNDAESEEEQRFVKMIQKTIRRTFLKMGAIVGTGVLAVVLCGIGHFHAQIVGGYLKAAAGAGRGLFKDQGNVFAPQLVVPDTSLLFGFQVSGQFQQLPDLGRGVVQ